MIYSSPDIEQNILKLVILGHFLSFSPLKTPKIKILKKEKNCWRYPHFTSHFTYVYQKLQSYDVWSLRYGVQQTKFFVTMDCFLFIYPMNPENQNFEKMKKRPGDIIILHTCTKNYDQMMYSS